MGPGSVTEVSASESFDVGSLTFLMGLVMNLFCITYSFPRVASFPRENLFTFLKPLFSTLFTQTISGYSWANFNPLDNNDAIIADPNTEIFDMGEEESADDESWVFIL